MFLVSVQIIPFSLPSFLSKNKSKIYLFPHIFKIFLSSRLTDFLQQCRRVSGGILRELEGMGWCHLSWFMGSPEISKVGGGSHHPKLGPEILHL